MKKIKCMRIICCLLAAALSFTVLSFGAAAQSVQGDVNGDGNVNAMDIMLVRLYNAEYDVAMDTDLGDMNLDGKITSADIMAIRMMFAELYPAGAQENITAYALELFQNTCQTDENTVISPLSSLYALTMLANGADGQTLQEMEAVLNGGESIIGMNVYLQDYLQKQTGDHLLLANGLQSRSAVKSSYLNTVSKAFDAQVFAADAPADEINAWISQNTGGHVGEFVDDFAPDAMLRAFNALSFNAKWDTPYFEQNINEDTFTNAKGETKTVDMMFQVERKYIQDDHAIGFLKYYEGEDYALVALLPEEGMALSDYVKTLTPGKLKDFSTLKDSDATCSGVMPKFSVDMAQNLQEPLESMGVKRAFSDGADFSKLTEENAFISEMQHAASITVDASGTTAGAATSGVVSSDAAEAGAVVLNRPFVFVIMDVNEKIPLFMGTVNDCGE